MNRTVRDVRTAKATAARLRSRTAYRDESAIRALATAIAAFPGQVGVPPYTSLGLGDGVKVLHRVNAYKAVVQTPNGETALAVGLRPLYGTTAGGHTAPVDLRLLRHGSLLGPQAALAQLAIPTQSNRLLQFVGKHFAVQFSDGSPVLARVRGGTVYFANVPGTGHDTDVVVRPTPVGAEISFVLRSAFSNTSQTLAFHFPRGWHLGYVASTGCDVAIISSNGAVVATVPRPVAVDEQGHSLPAGYEIQGTSRLVVHVTFPRNGVTYPVIVDPQIADYSGSIPANVVNTWWEHFVSPSTAPVYAMTSSGYSGWEAAAPYGFTSGAAGEFAMPAPPGSWIYEMVESGVYHNPNNSYEYGGILSTATNAWEAGTWQNASGQTGSPAARYWPYAEAPQNSVTYCARPGCVDTGIAPRNIAVIGLDLGGPTANTTWPFMLVWDATLYLEDNVTPTLTAPQHSGYTPGTWVQNATDTITLSASTSTGLGVWGVHLSAPLPNGTTINDGCTAATYDPCPMTYTPSITYNTSTLPEGADTVSAQAWSMTSHVSQLQSWTVDIDRTPPSVTLSGTAWTAPIQSTNTGTLLLDVSASDPNVTNPGGATSGVVSITTSVNGSVYPAGPNASQSCPQGGCALNADGVINVSDLHAGDNDIELDVADAAGNVSRNEWSIELPGEDPSIQAAATQTYATDYGVSSSTASAAVALQDATAPEVDTVSADIGSDYAGAWYDPNANGILDIGVAAPNPSTVPGVATAEALLSSNQTQADVQFVSESSAWTSLEATQAALDSQMASQEAAGDVQTSIDPSSNAVVMTTTTGFPAAAASRVTSSIADARPFRQGYRHKVRIIIKRSSAHSLIAHNAACIQSKIGFASASHFCDPPVRGGDFMTNTSAKGTYGCTIGFVVLYDNFLPGVLTAGHCINDDGGCNSAKWTSEWSTGTTYQLGSPTTGQDGECFIFGANVGQYSDSGDVGLLGLTNFSWVTPHMESYIYEQPPGQPGNRVYWIHTSGHAPLHSVICATSGLTLPNGGNTACGTVTGLNVTVTYAGNVRVPGLGESDTCNGIHGASGGPFFKNGVGYGIMSGFNAKCDVFYQGLSGALGAMGATLYNWQDA